MENKENIKKLADYIPNAELKLIIDYHEVSRALGVSELDAINLMESVGAKKNEGERYVFKEDEPERYKKLDEMWSYDYVDDETVRVKEYVSENVDGKVAIKVDEKVFKTETEESKYFHELFWKDGEKDGFYWIFRLRPGNEKIGMKKTYVLQLDNDEKMEMELNEHWNEMTGKPGFFEDFFENVWDPHFNSGD